MVNTHAQIILPATPQRTAESLLVEPTPTMAPVIVWVVLTGIPAIDRTNNGAGGGRFSTAAANRLKFGNLGPHRFDNPPAAEHCSQRNHRIAGDNNPKGNMEGIVHKSFTV